MQIARRMRRLGTETAFDVLAKAKELERKGRSIIHLEIGEPDFDTPQNICEAAKKALDKGYTHYNPSAGLPELREIIASDISKRRKIKVESKNVVVTPGGKPIIFFSILACVNEGDEVIYPNPGFPIYESMINFIHARPVPIQLREKNDFSLDVNELKRKVTKKTKMIIINSPQNPTGGILTKEDLKAISEISLKRNIWILSDEIYNRIIYEFTFESITQFQGMLERTIILDGFSKTYAMTGWRMGYGVMPEELASHVSRLMTNSNSCTATFTQRAGLEAIGGSQEEVDRMVAEFKRRRDMIVEGLNAIDGFNCKKPLGAFYVFPSIKDTKINSQKLADRLLEEGGVACLSGTCFGKYGEGYIRFSYANSIENIKEALERIKKVLKK